MNDENETVEAPVVGGKPVQFGLLLLYSLLLFVGAYVIDQTVRWTNHFEGFLNGLVHTVFMGIPWACLLLPWSLLVWVLYRWRHWRRYRTAWVLLPAVLAFLMQISTLITSPPTAEGRFREITGVKLPEEISGLQVHFFGGGFVDYSDTYSFRCSAEVTDELIRAMKLEEDESLTRARELDLDFYSPVPLKDDWPDYRNWPGLKQFRRDDNSWFYYLLTDESRTKIYIFTGCI